MKAFIFNSGSGTRMGELTKNNPKALVELSNGETILGRQIRLLRKAGIKDIIISTGPFEDQIISLTNQFNDLKFSFINNPIYKDTNSIYSLYLSKSVIDDDMIVLHGDLVFDYNVLISLINSKNTDLCLINTKAKLPAKDFKGRIVNNNLKEISVNIFDENCYALQPLYKFSVDTMNKWLKSIDSFVLKNDFKVYAENALNLVLEHVNVAFLDYHQFYIEEIDNVDDLIRVSNEFRQFDYKSQEIVHSQNYLSEIKNYIKRNGLRNPFIVHGKHLLKDTEFNDFLITNDFPSFCNFSSNPKYEEVVNGLRIFKDSNCDSIIAIGGGSCIDVAKAIKLYSIHDQDYIHQKTKYVILPLVAIPTTAGTGTESTRYSVIYYNGEKQSLVNDSLLPDFVVLNENFLIDIPDYHKKSSLLDAFCQAIESYWSINSNDASKQISHESLRLIIDNYQEYLKSNIDVYSIILKASNLAGKAINITETTAPHAMSYKLTTIANISHGHAVSIMLPYVTQYIIDNVNLCTDTRGEEYLKQTLLQLANIFNTKVNNLAVRVVEIISEFRLEKPLISEDLIIVLSESINQTRLKNNPVSISFDKICQIYEDALI